MIRSLAIGVLLAAVAMATAQAADSTAGQKVFKSQCAICHSVTAGKNMIGPSLFGLVGRKAGQEPGYTYSSANKNSGITWTEAELNKYLTNPQAIVPGTKMPYAGLKNDDQRADLIAYLATLH